MVAFDNSQFASDLEEKRLSASQAGSDLATAEAELKTTRPSGASTSQRRAPSWRRRGIAASVPQEILPLREYQDRQLALKRAETELAKAEEVLATGIEGERHRRRDPEDRARQVAARDPHRRGVDRGARRSRRRATA